MIDRESFLKVSENVLFDEPMKLHTSFKIGGNADVFISASDIDEIKAAVSLCKKDGVPYMIMGNGTNMLVGDGGIRGAVIQLRGGLQEYSVDGERVTAQSGILMSKLASVLMREGLSGFEALSGIPGTLGGGIYMNAGAYGSEIKDVVKEVTYITPDGEVKTSCADELDFSYRHSMFCGGEYIILSAVLELKKGEKDKIKAETDEYNKRRCEKQPLNMPSAGSTFKRPEGYFAGKLIQDSGLMGYTVGGAQVSEKHAGFVVNCGGATAKDVTELIEYIKNTVKEKSGVELVPEIRLIGEK